MAKFKLTKNNYYSTEANRLYWSASFVKAMLDCPERAIAERNGEYTRSSSTALLVGQYVDSFFDGKIAFDSFVSSHPEICNKRTGELKSEFAQAKRMIERAKQDSVFMSFLKGQRQKIFTGEIEGIPFKCKLDFYMPDRIVDLKTVKDFEAIYREGEGKLSFIEYWRWDLQMAIYRELVRQKTGKTLPCYLACITKQEPADLELIEIPSHVLDMNMEYLKKTLPRLDAMAQGLIQTERCGKCEYCRATKKIMQPISADEFSIWDV